ncbi:MAG: hypothetical protein HYS74_00880 [Parcubacteria group bacterium]|nr:hypothetical protein [Parcubacteria group bacterium]
MFQNISQYLLKFRNIAPPDDALLVACAACLKEETGIALSKKDIAFRGGVFFLSKNIPAKSEVFIKKSGIIQKMQSLFPAVPIKDIR